MLRTVIFLLVVAFSTSSSFGQALEMLNKTVSDQNSKTLYVGVDNVFQLNGVQSVVEQEGVSLNMNTLTVKPTSVGTQTIVFMTANGKESITFNVRTVPEINAVVGGNSSTINKATTMTSQLSFKPVDFGDNFYQNYSITSYTASIGGNMIQVNGNNFSKELITAIANAKTGDMLVISSMKAFNPDLNKSLDLRGNFAFSIE